METKHWKAVMRKSAPSGLAGDTGVERWKVVEDAGPKFPPEMGVEIPMHGEQGRINAHLQAAAPALLAACEAALGALDWSVTRAPAKCEALDAALKVRAAIAAAKGGEA